MCPLILHPKAMLALWLLFGNPLLFEIDVCRVAYFASVTTRSPTVREKIRELLALYCFDRVALGRCSSNDLPQESCFSRPGDGKVDGDFTTKLVTGVVNLDLTLFFAFQVDGE